MYNHYHRVYYEFVIDHLSMWLDSSLDRAQNTKKSSLDRALHRYRKIMGSNPVQA